MDSDHLSFFQFRQQAFDVLDKCTATKAFDVLFRTSTQFYKGNIDIKENGEENVSFILVC